MKILNLALDPVVNFGKVTLATGYDSTALSVALQTGHGTRLPDPSPIPFNLVWWNSSKYADPSDDPNVEIVRCTTKAIDSLIIARPQEGTVASNKNSAGDIYKMILAPTKKMFTDIPADAQARVDIHAAVAAPHSGHARVTNGSFAGDSTANRAITHSLTTFKFALLFTTFAAAPGNHFIGIHGGRIVHSGNSETVIAPDGTNFYTGGAITFMGNISGATYLWVAVGT